MAVQRKSALDDIWDALRGASNPNSFPLLDHFTENLKVGFVNLLGSLGSNSHGQDVAAISPPVAPTFESTADPAAPSRLAALFNRQEVAGVAEDFQRSMGVKPPAAEVAEGKKTLVLNEEHFNNHDVPITDLFASITPTQVSSLPRPESSNFLST